MKQFRSPRRQAGVINLGGIGVVLCLVFVFYCALGDKGHERYRRICSPFAVTSNLFTSIAALLYDGSEVGVKEVFDNITYGCTYTVWRLTAEKDWQAYVDEMKRQGKPIPGVDTGTGDVAPQTGERKVKTVSGASAEETKTGGVTKPVQPAIDVKGAVERIDIPDLPAFPGSSEYEEQKREAEAGRGG